MTPLGPMLTQRFVALLMKTTVGGAWWSHINTPISKWDLNKNGRLDPDEMGNFRQDKQQQRQNDLDMRARSAAELRRYEATTRTNRIVPPRLLQKYDGNTNGMMDPGEWATYYRDVELRRGNRARVPTGTNSVRVEPPPAPSARP